MIRLKEGVVGVLEIQRCHTVRGFLLPAEEFTQRKKLVRHINWGHTSLAAGQRYWDKMYLSASSNCMEMAGF